MCTPTPKWALMAISWCYRHCKLLFPYLVYQLGLLSPSIPSNCAVWPPFFRAFLLCVWLLLQHSLACPLSPFPLVACLRLLLPSSSVHIVATGAFAPVLNVHAFLVFLPCLSCLMLLSLPCPSCSPKNTAASSWSGPGHPYPQCWCVCWSVECGL